MLITNGEFAGLRERFIYYFSAVGIFSTLIFGVIPNIRAGNSFLALYELILTSIATLNVIVFYKKKNYTLASVTILVLMILVLFALIKTGGFNGTGILWVYTFPLLSFFLRPDREAFFWNTLLISLAILLIFLQAEGIVEVYYSTLQLRQALGAYIAVFLLSYFYSRVINRLLGILRERAIKDPLTGLYNRDFVFETLEKILHRVKRGDKNSYCLAYIDLDGFKYVNDRYGHHEGDRVLKEVSNRIQSSFRKGDVVGRIGGDEFITLVYNCTPQRVEERLSNLRNEISRDPSMKGISLSFGVVKIDEGADDVDKLLHEADERMYDMKRSKKSG